MALNIRNSEAESLAGKLARLTGETKTEALKKVHSEELDGIALHCASLPVLDSRSVDEILYDEKGNDFLKTDIKAHKNA